MKKSKHLSETGKQLIERANTPENLLNLVSQAQVSFEMDFKNSRFHELRERNKGLKEMIAESKIMEKSYTEKEFLRDIERQFIRPWGKEAK